MFIKHKEVVMKSMVVTLLLAVCLYACENEAFSTVTDQPDPPQPPAIEFVADLLANTDQISDLQVTGTGFSTTPDNISNQAQDTWWGNYSFQTQTAFSNYLRLSVTGNLTIAQQNNLLSTIQHSKNIGREIILLLDRPTMSNPDQLAVQLAFLQPYFNNGTIKWFEIFNEAWNFYSGNFQQKALAYCTEIKTYIPAIKTIQPDAKIMISTIEGNFAYGNSSWVTQGEKWTKDIINNLYSSGYSIDAVSVHLYPTRGFDITKTRLFSTGACLDKAYRTIFSDNYFSGNAKGLFELFQNAINGKDIKIFFTEYSQFITGDDTPLSNSLRKGMFNALEFSNIYNYLAKNNVTAFCLHQLGLGGGNYNSFQHDGWNTLNSSWRYTPATLAVKLLSEVNGSYIPHQLNNSPVFSTTGAALQDSTGSLEGISNIPYITSSVSRLQDTLFIVLTNIKESHIAVNFNLVGDLNLTNLNFSGKIISATSLTTNNDLSENIKIENYYGLTNNSAVLPPYSIVVLKGVKNSNSIKGDQRFNHDILNNYPNPFNSTTKISYYLQSKESYVNLSIFNAKGEIVKQLINQNQAAGNHNLEFNANGLQSGVYYYQLETDRKRIINRMLLIK